MCFLYCLYMTGPYIFDYIKRLIQLTVIPLSGGHCTKKAACETFVKKSTSKMLVKLTHGWLRKNNEIYSISLSDCTSPYTEKGSIVEKMFLEKLY
jgi:hypothetical protein